MDEIDRAAELLAAAQEPAIVAGDGCGLSGSWPELVQLAETLGAPVFSESLSTCMNFPSRDYHRQCELPPSVTMRDTLGAYDTVIFCGFSSHAPMTVYDGGPPLIPDAVTKTYLHYNEWEIAKNFPAAAAILGDVKTSLRPLIAAINRFPRDTERIDQRNADLKRRHDQLMADWRSYIDDKRHAIPINSAYVAAELARFDPPGLVYVDESNTAIQPFQRLLDFRDPLSYFSGRGVALGYSMPAALGTALAAPERTIVNVVGDGAALFYPQVFCTAAKYRLPVLFVVLNNGDYKTLKQGLEAMREFWRPNTDVPGLDLGPPLLDHARIANAYGIESIRVTQPDQVAEALEIGLSSRRPFLVEFLVQREIDDTWPTG